MNIAVVVGTRAELIKMFPLMRELESYDFLATGQHDLSYLVERFELPEPRYAFNPPKLHSRFFGSTVKALLFFKKLVLKLKKEFEKNKPKLVLYHGDTLSTAAAAVASRLAKVKGVHVEAGLRSFDIFEPFPEEISRIIADKSSDLLIAPSKIAYENLKSYRAKRFLAGNTIVDSAKLALKKSRLKAPEEEYAIAMVHRHENLKSPLRLRKIVEIIELVPIKVYFFYYHHVIARLKELGLYERLENKVEFVEALPYPEFLSFLKGSKLILTDGGSIQEESLIFRKPCLILRKKTERIAGLATGLNFLTKLSKAFSEQVIELVLDKSYRAPKFKNPYGEFGVSKKIAKILGDFLD